MALDCRRRQRSLHHGHNDCIELCSPESSDSRSPGEPRFVRVDRLATGLAGARHYAVVPGGGYVVKTTPLEEQTTDGESSERRSPSATNAIVVSATSNLIGYEVSLYSVKPRHGGRVRLAFVSAEVHKKDQWTSSRQPIYSLLHSIRAARCVRILHLSRGTHDHSAAILAANSSNALQALTLEVKSSPAACESGADFRCIWIPSGIAVIPESWRGVG